MYTSKSTILFLMVLVVSCGSVKKNIEASKPYSEQINWPEEYSFENTKFFVHNEIEINASPQTVWNILIEAETWPKWYEGAFDVAIQNSEKTVLEPNSVFTWKTMGLDFESTVKEFEPYSRLSWESKKKSIKGYHAWLIVPTESGCMLITDESQYGFLTFLQKVFMPNKLRKLHDIWLAEIKLKAESKNN